MIAGTALPASTSRTTQWRKRKLALGGARTGKKNKRKIYSCSTCEKPVTSEGHTGFKGKRYCPHAEGQIPQQQWLQNMRAAAEKRAKINAKRKHMCKYCDRRFKLLSDMHEHQRKHVKYLDEEEDVEESSTVQVVEQCETQLTSQSQAKKRKHTCKYCDKSFKLLSDVHQHQRKHVKYIEEEEDLEESSTVQVGGVCTGKKIPRKVYSCSTCDKPMKSEGHTHFKGKRYCPHAEGQIPQQQWLQNMRAAAENGAKTEKSAKSKSAETKKSAKSKSAETKKSAKSKSAETKKSAKSKSAETKKSAKSKKSPKIKGTETRLTSSCSKEQAGSEEVLGKTGETTEEEEEEEEEVLEPLPEWEREIDFADM